MHIRLLAVGDRQPRWVDEAFGLYAGRFPREWRFRLETLATAKRGKNALPARAIEDEGKRLLARISSDDQVVLLDEHGGQMSSQALAKRLAGWQEHGRNLTFVIGGPDGVGDDFRQRANVVWSLSSLTLPHGLARVLFAEQMYRAASMLAGHPYHRD